MARKRQLEGQKNDQEQKVYFSMAEHHLVKSAARKQKSSVSLFCANASVEEAEKVLGMTVDEFEMATSSRK